jgi:hypothetical protein
LRGVDSQRERLCGPPPVLRGKLQDAGPQPRQLFLRLDRDGLQAGPVKRRDGRVQVLVRVQVERREE